MKIAKLIAGAALVISPIFGFATVASAQPVQQYQQYTQTQQRGMTGSYIGAGLSAGVTNGGKQNDDATFGGNVQGRYAIPKSQVSVRGAALFGGDSTALIPTLTLDAPIAKNTNVYVGGGYAFQTNEGYTSQLGNKNTPVVTLGAESQIAKNVVVYGDAKWGIDAYKDSSADAVSLQTGVGYSF
ncbi:MAG: porin family protein [Calothrix sp. CSU_2_0]|nr:porin family protein [Calothrix sp. CSU_2_0]